jgi:Protein kinase domain
MGVVYKAEDIRLGRQLALKFLSDELAQDEQAVEHFKRETRAASALSNPHICTIHDADEDHGRPFIAMELLEGYKLKKSLSGGPLPMGEIVDLAIHVADGLEATHRKGIAHWDRQRSKAMTQSIGSSQSIQVSHLIRTGIFWKVVAIGVAALAIPLGACTVGQTRIAFGVSLSADLGTTQAGINGGATEANSALKGNPVLIAAVSSAVVVAIAEYLTKRGNDSTASWLYGAGAALHTGAAFLNAGQLGGSGSSTSAVTTGRASTMRINPAGIGQPSVRRGTRVR